MPLMLIALAFFLVKGPSDAVGTMDNSFLRIEEGFFHDFGSQNSGVTVSAALTLRNDGTENATSLSFLALSTPFSWTGGSFPGNGGDCGASLSGGASCLLDVSFTPSASGSFSEFLSASYTYDGSSEEVVINLVGVGTDTGGLSISESPFFSFPVVAIGENENHVFTITNTTTSTDASSLLISGLSAPFTFNGGSFPGTNGNCGSSLLGSQSCDIDILFSPTFEDVFQDTMTISYVMNSAAKSIELPIDGAGKNLTDVSILSAPDILFNNATAYEISGGCSENGQEVTLDIGGLTPSPQPTCTLGQWQLSAFDASSLANGNVIITADHEDTFGNMADQATVTVLRSDVVPPEAIVDLYVPASDFESVDLSWTSPADNGTAITDYIIEFKEYDDTTWQTFADGLSTATSTTVTGLNSSTLYQFRVFAVNVPTGEPSNIVTVHTLINDTFFDPNSHAAFNLGGATTSQVAAFDDNTTVLRNGSFLALLNRGQTANFTSAIDDVITADNPVVVAGRAGATGGNGNGGNIIWSVPYWAGRRFLFNGSRNGPHEIRVHAFENSTVDIIRGNITDATQVIAADDEHTFDLTNNASYEINSTGLIIVYGRSRNNGNTYYDPMPIMPASLRVLGLSLIHI